MKCYGTLATSRLFQRQDDGTFVLIGDSFGQFDFLLLTWTAFCEKTERQLVQTFYPNVEGMELVKDAKPSRQELEGLCAFYDHIPHRWLVSFYDGDGYGQLKWQGMVTMSPEMGEYLKNELSQGTLVSITSSPPGTRPIAQFH